jgi:hypothetical protein
MAGCGGSSNSSTQATTTGLTKRALISNQLAGTVIIEDAQKDQFSATALPVTGASKMVTAGGVTAVLQSGQASIAIITSSNEQVATQPALSGVASDIAITPDGKTVFAAIHNAGIVDVITSDGTVTPVAVPSPSRLVISPNGIKLLVFSDNPPVPAAVPPAAANTGVFFALDVASKTVSPVAGPNLDQPFTAVFTGSDTQAFVLNCGAECGGTAASVIVADFTTANSPGFGVPVSVSAATVGLLSGSTLFVAGTPSGSPTGTLQALNSTTLAAGPAISITDGLHTKMRATSNGRLYVGASTCTPINDAATGLVRGCLSIVNTTSNAVTFPEFSPLRSFFDVTGLQPISNRNIMYVIEGGELDIYDITQDALRPQANQLDVVGKAVDVVQIDP